MQRAGSAHPGKLVGYLVRARDAAASGFVDVAGLSLPVSADRQRVGIGGGGVELTVRLGARQRREARAPGAAGAKVIVRLAVVGTDRAGNSAQVGARDPATSLGGSRPRTRSTFPAASSTSSASVALTADPRKRRFSARPREIQEDVGGPGPRARPRRWRRRALRLSALGDVEESVAVH